MTAYVIFISSSSAARTTRDAADDENNNGDTDNTTRTAIFRILVTNDTDAAIEEFDFIIYIDFYRVEFFGFPNKNGMNESFVAGGLFHDKEREREKQRFDDLLFVRKYFMSK